MSNYEAISSIISEVNDLSLDLANQLRTSVVYYALGSSTGELSRSLLLNNPDYRYRPRDPDKRAQMVRESEQKSQRMARLGAEYAGHVPHKRIPPISRYLAVAPQEAQTMNLEKRAERMGVSVTELAKRAANVNAELKEDAEVENAVRESLSSQITDLYHSILDGTADYEGDLTFEEFASVVQSLSNTAQMQTEWKQGQALRAKHPRIAERLDADARLYGEVNDRLADLVIRTMEQREQELQGTDSSEFKLFQPDRAGFGEGEEYDPTAHHPDDAA